MSTSSPFDSNTVGSISFSSIASDNFINGANANSDLTISGSVNGALIKMLAAP
jgi:hypothetical protein